MQLTQEYLPYFPWLTKDGEELLTSELAGATQNVALSWSRELGLLTSSRSAVMGRTNILSLFEDEGFRAESPLEHPVFVRSLQRAGGLRGFGDRTTMMRRLFTALLPDTVLSRRTKAAFNDTRFTEREREFIHEWRGSGVDHRFIDVERLKVAWLERGAPPESIPHLHVAWLSEYGLPLVPDGS